MACPPPTYTREEMDAILKRAIERQQAKSEGIGHEELVEAAGEVGIPREEVEAAARELEAQKENRGEVRPAGGGSCVPDRGVSEGARSVGSSGGPASFGVLTAFFFFLSGMQLNGWWIWPAMGFGISLAMTAIKLVFGDERDEGERSDRRQTRRERRRLRREENVAEFERKVAIGADALVRVVEEARRVKGEVEAERPARAAGAGEGARDRDASAAVRVETREGAEASSGRDGSEAGGPGEAGTVGVASPIGTLLSGNRDADGRGARCSRSCHRFRGRPLLPR